MPSFADQVRVGLNETGGEGNDQFQVLPARFGFHCQVGQGEMQQLGGGQGPFDLHQEPAHVRGRQRQEVDRAGDQLGDLLLLLRPTALAEAAQVELQTDEYLRSRRHRGGQPFQHLPPPHRARGAAQADGNRRQHHDLALGATIPDGFHNLRRIRLGGNGKAILRQYRSAAGDVERGGCEPGQNWQRGDNPPRTVGIHDEETSKIMIAEKPDAARAGHALPNADHARAPTGSAVASNRVSSSAFLNRAPPL